MTNHDEGTPRSSFKHHHNNSFIDNVQLLETKLADLLARMVNYSPTGSALRLF
jgi:hypothetical protein